MSMNEQNPQSLEEKKADIKESFDQDNFSVSETVSKKSETPQMKPISARLVTYKQGNDYVIPQN